MISSIVLVIYIFVLFGKSFHNLFNSFIFILIIISFPLPPFMILCLRHSVGAGNAKFYCQDFRFKLENFFIVVKPKSRQQKQANLASHKQQHIYPALSHSCFAHTHIHILALSITFTLWDLRINVGLKVCLYM